jgi:predicted DNA-binding transcriptional regulator YafY
LNPLGLVSKDGMLYLVATEWNYKDPTHYALHRFVSAECSENVALVPDGFDFNRYVGEQEAFGYPESSDPIALEVLVSQDIANHLSERPLSKDQKIALLSEDQCRVTATVSDTQELRWWLRGFGAQLEVLKPATLRKEFKADALDLAEQYSARAPRSPKSPTVESVP